MHNYHHNVSLQLLGDGKRNKYYLYEYRTRRSGQENDISHLIWKFKGNEASAINDCQTRMANAIEQSKANFLQVTNRWYCIAIPRSKAYQQNHGCEDVCAYLDDRFSWITHLPEALVRVSDVLSSRLASTEGRPRPSVEEHKRTIQYRGPYIHQTAGIILVDDILTKGNTFNACYDILKSATHNEQIFGIFIGWTPPFYGS